MGYLLLTPPLNPFANVKVPLTHSLLRSRGGSVVFVPIHPFLRIGESSILAIDVAQKVIKYYAKTDLLSVVSIAL